LNSDVTSGYDTNRTTSDVRNSVAVGGEPDIARKAQTGSD